MKNKLFPIGIGGGLLVIVVIYSIIQGTVSPLALSNRFFLTGLPFLLSVSCFGFFFRLLRSLSAFDAPSV